MDRYLFDAKVGLIRNKHGERRATKPHIDTATEQGGIRVMTNLGSQNAIGGKLPDIAKQKEEEKVIKTLDLLVNKLKPEIPPHVPETKPKEMGLIPKTKEMSLIPEPKEMGLAPPKEMRIDLPSLREVKERKKDEAEARSETIKQPMLRPPFALYDKEAEKEYGQYLRARYPGSVGRLEYDKMIEDDIAFTAVLNYAEDVQKQYIVEFQDPHAGSRDLGAFFGNLAVALGKELAKEVVKTVVTSVGDELFKPPSGETEEQKKAREKTETVTYKVPDFIKDKIAENVSKPISSFYFKTHQDMLDGIMAQYNALFQGEPRAWKSKITYYTGLDIYKMKLDGTTDYIKDIEKRRNKEGEKREEQLTQTHEQLKAKYDPIIKQEKLDDDKLQSKADSYARNQAIEEGKLAIWEKTPFDIRERKNFALYKKYIMDNNIKTDYAKKSLTERTKLRKERIEARVYKLDWKKMGYQKNIDIATKEYDTKYSWML